MSLFVKVTTKIIRTFNLIDEEGLERLEKLREQLIKIVETGESLLDIILD